MTLDDIKARHQQVEGQAWTMSVGFLTERKSKSHKDRAWLIEQLEAALAQNDKLSSRLDKVAKELKALKSSKKTGGRRAKKT